MAQYVDISLDKPRRLRFTINAIRELERHFGTSFSNIFDPENMGFEQIIMLLTVGLKYGETEKRPLNDTKVGDLVQRKWLDNGKELSDLSEFIIEGMRAAGIIAPKEEEEDNLDQPKAVKGPGDGGSKELPNA